MLYVKGTFKAALYDNLTPHWNLVFALCIHLHFLQTVLYGITSYVIVEHLTIVKCDRFLHCPLIRRKQYDSSRGKNHPSTKDLKAHQTTSGENKA